MCIVWIRIQIRVLHGIHFTQDHQVTFLHGLGPPAPTETRTARTARTVWANWRPVPVGVPEPTAPGDIGPPASHGARSAGVPGALDR